MNEKYLPLGTVCEITGRKVLIIGYGVPNLKDSLKIMDYVGCAYPEGLLALDKIICFNNSEIDKIHFLGFVSDEFKNFNQLLNGKIQELYEDENTLSQDRVYTKFNFDENGVVKNETVYGFNNAGVLVSTDTKTLAVPEQKMDSYEFDENGTLISVNGRTEETTPSVPEVSANVASKNISKYKFDENGTLISIEENIEEITPVVSEIPENVVAENKTKYKFDENGTLISIDDITE